MRLIHHLQLLLAACLLASCVIQDPEFARTASQIQDIDYPPNKIIGSWFHVEYDPARTNRRDMEYKQSIEFHPGGRGTHYQYAKNLADGRSIELEGDITWSYLGRNHWQVVRPPTSGYRVIRTKGLSIGQGPGVTLDVRYHDGKLYYPRARQIWVPHTENEVRRLLNRMRQARLAQQTVIQIE